MAQTVYLGKDVFLSVGPSGSEVNLHGVGNGLISVTQNDPSEIQEKAGTGDYREKYVTGIRRPMLTINVQLGSVTYNALVGKHGTEMAFTWRSRGTQSGRPQWTGTGFIQEPSLPFDVNAPSVDGAFELHISGAPNMAAQS